MSDAVYRQIANASSGFVEAAAGCGKTEAIVQTVRSYCHEPQLILTHTHAGVDALRQRFKMHNVPSKKFNVDTISGWAWGWVRRYPDNANYRGSIEFADWGEVYAAMTTLLQKDFVKQSILNSYAGVLVDEYQDCTVLMHLLITRLKGILPCRVLGDDLQGIFSFGGEQLISWADVQGEFGANLGTLDTPHRWVRAGNPELGNWLIGARTSFLSNRAPSFSNSPIEHRAITYRELGAYMNQITNDKDGRICVIGPKARRLPVGVETILVKRSYKVLEPNELSALKKLIKPFTDGSRLQKATAAINFIKEVYGSLSTEDKSFMEKILKKENQRPRRADRKALCDSHKEGANPHVLLAILQYADQLNGVNCKLKESVSALKCILEEHIETGSCLSSIYADEISRRKIQNRNNVYRCIGSTLLVKGLEFDHAVILRGQNWGGLKDLYVALTRGSKSVTLLDIH